MSRDLTREPGAAIAGGISLCVPQLAGNEAAYLRECVETNMVSSVGPFVTLFEELLAKRVGTSHAIATASGTAALHVALLAAGVKADDEVLVSSLTFIAPANAIRYAGAWPVFVDCDPDYWQMDVGLVAEFLEDKCAWRDGALRNRATGRRVSAIVPVHVLGHPVDMAPLKALGEKYSIGIVEDATESLGASYRGQAVGTLGDIACFSFNGNKVITTGAGGMVVTNRADWAERVRYLTTQAKDDPIEYKHNEVGYNYRLSNVQAALGCAQLERLDEHLAAKKALASGYIHDFAGAEGVNVMREASWASSAWWLFTALFDPRVAESRALMAMLGRERIQSRPLWQPLHRSVAHRGAQALGGSVAERLHRDALTLPSSVGLSEADRRRVSDLVRRALTA